ncbi:probable Xaa-Pro aminopeptidase 3 [Fopius arisanus]|uniref:Probable Xaa-Pro aminopeptidase 3 n=1 Tax=Fopius arisanus TaxID=64838 RepID=A0A9R1UBE5_9HYME|nr:PREDICTED: probable Xaa-Pro aminopeptidase 3 [Fopius arisanus]
MHCFLRKCLVNQVTKINKRCIKFSSSISENPKTESCVKPQIPRVYGQPTPQSHPHLVRPGELVPGIKLHEFKERRTKLFEKIITKGYVGKTSSKHILIIPSASKVYMSDKIPYVFRQNTDFMYFSGCQEPDCALVMTIDGDSYTTTIFMQNKDDKTELWDGPRTGAEAGAELFGVDQAYPMKDLELFVSSFVKGHQNNCNLWYEEKEIIQMDVHRKMAQVIKTTGLKSRSSPKTFFHEIRLIKSESEVELMRESCRIGSKAIARTIQTGRPGMSEHHIFATVDYECRMRGAEYLAYLPVVAGGSNANVIHYVANNQIVKDGSMVLMDAGCEYHGYSSDITRTWPINGTFTDPQRVLYEIVLETQKILINQLAELPTLDMLFHEMCRILGRRLQEGGLIPKTMNDNQLISAAYLYCPHHVSHYLGMDVHDTGTISRGVRTQPGMIVTVEPGVYVSSKNKLAPPEFCGLGIRIEDDVLITDSGPVVLTEPCPKEISDIEFLIKSNKS